MASAPAADARKLFSGPSVFLSGAVDPSGYPKDGVPEIAFAGRSNVGKSSLLNAIVGRRGLARASNTPGRTREINFFDVGGALRLVDLPGYGYARAPRGAVRNWTLFVSDYLRDRSELRRVCLLIDARRGVGPYDVEVMDALDGAAVSYQLVLTKADKVKPSDLAMTERAAAAATARRAAAHPVALATSAETGLGLEALREELAAFAR